MTADCFVQVRWLALQLVDGISEEHQYPCSDTFVDLFARALYGLRSAPPKQVANDMYAFLLLHERAHNGAASAETLARV